MTILKRKPPVRNGLATGPKLQPFLPIQTTLPGYWLGMPLSVAVADPETTTNPLGDVMGEGRRSLLAWVLNKNALAAGITAHRASASKGRKKEKHKVMFASGAMHKVEFEIVVTGTPA
ncbi:hypothetical protein [Pseudomonas helleri]|uniref:hypothetical protein n=1 Tax=Pseudomonas helleri TaxID=1608996 RepID=UPI003FD41A4A